MDDEINLLKDIRAKLKTQVSVLNGIIKKKEKLNKSWKEGLEV